VRHLLNKSFVTNVVALVLALIGFLTRSNSVWGDAIYQAGIFAFSGAITNWLAIYMLFEKVPFLYGSGVIPTRFEEFKRAIKELVIGQFFSKDNLDRFLKSSNGPAINVENLTKVINYDQVYSELVGAITASPLGGMLLMFGGEKLLAPMKEPLISKMRDVVHSTITSEQFQIEMAKELGGSAESFSKKIEAMVDTRLSELTPQLVKEIIQRMIREHLGWLVVWGGVFGAVIGLVAAFFK